MPGLTKSFKERVFCGVFLHRSNRGADLSSQLLAERSHRRLGLSLDSYGEAEAEDD